jgi:hypothetical protein
MGHGKAGGSIAKNRLASNVFKRSFTSQKIFAESGTDKAGAELVAISMRSYFVTTVVDFRNKMRETLSYPSQHKERCLNLMLIKEI